MLVLTRKKFEEIRIGDDIVIKVIQTGKNTVKIGIDAPKAVRVVRGELQIDSHPNLMIHESHAVASKSVSNPSTSKDDVVIAEEANMHDLGYYLAAYA
jgi:carbon storage regulator CsrA